MLYKRQYMHHHACGAVEALVIFENRLHFSDLLEFCDLVFVKLISPIHLLCEFIWVRMLVVNATDFYVHFSLDSR